MNKKVIERLFLFSKTTFHSFFIHELLLFLNKFICPSGNLDAKTFEIKNLKLKGDAPVELRYIYSFFFLIKKTNQKSYSYDLLLFLRYS